MGHRPMRRLGLAVLSLATLGLAACEVRQATQSAVGTWASGRFGESVAISGNGLVMAVGVPNATRGAASRAGHVVIYERLSFSLEWEQTEIVLPPNDWAEQRFGFALDLTYTGGTLAVGAPSIDGSQTGSAGRAYVFTRSGQEDEFILASTLIPSTETGQRFGASIALDKEATKVVVGAPRATVGTHVDAGTVYVYDSPTVGLGGTIAWVKRANLSDFIPQGSNSAAGSAEFGFSLDIDDMGYRLIVGAPFYNAVATDDGLARVFNWSAATSTFTGYQPVPVQLKAGDPDMRGTNANFGYDVAMSGSGRTVVVGAPNRDGGRGGAVSATIDDASGTWVAKQLYKADAVINAGASVDLNSSGERAIVGLPLQQNGGAKKGWFVVMNPVTGERLYAGDPAEYAENNEIGYSVAISDGGSFFAAGSPNHSSNRGRVMVYESIPTPTVPVDVESLALNKTVVITWKPPLNAAAELATRYIVRVVGEGRTCLTTGLSCTFAGLTNGTRYTFELLAKAADRSSPVVTLQVMPFDWSTVVDRPVIPPAFAGLLDASLINPDGTIKGGVPEGSAQADTPTTGDGTEVATPGGPLAPEGVMAVAGRRKITVSWTAPAANTAQPILGYTVTATSPKGTKTCTAEADQTTCVIAKLGDNKAWDISVSAFNVIGAGAAANVSGKVWTQPKISRRTGATLKHVARHAGLASGKGTTVTLSLRGAIAKANCAVVNGRVFAKAAGPCRVRVVSKKGTAVARKTLVVRAVR